MIFVFGDCELDLDRFELRRAGRLRPVEPQVFDLLAVLIRERHRVVPKEELLDTVWGNRFVSESALTSRVKAARQAIGDDGRSQRLVRTVHGRGYQFVAPVDEAAQPDPAASVSPAPPRAGDPVLHGRRWHPPCLRDQRRRPAAGEGRELAQPPRLRLGKPGLAALAGRAVAPVPPRPVRRARLRAVGLGHRTVLVRATGWTTWRPSSTPPGWTGSRCSASRRAARSPSPTRCATPNASPTWCCSAHSPKAGARRARTSDDLELAEARIEIVRLGWGRPDPTYRQIFVARFLPDATQEQWRSFDELQRRSTSPDNAWRFVDEFANIDVTDLAPKLTVPTLIMCARREPDNRFEQSRLLAALIPNSRLVPLDSSNHLLPERDPAWKHFLAEIDRFLPASR